jgi:outer membrane protein
MLSLEKAESLVHAPTTAVPLAMCNIQFGRLVAGTEILQRVINEPLPPNAPPAFIAAQRDARGMLDAATPRIARLRIHVDMLGGVPPNLEVFVDNQRVPLVLLDNDRPTDPGQHHIVVRQPGGASTEMDVSVGEGQVTPVSLRLAGGGAYAGAPVTGGIPDPYGQGVITPPPPPPGGQPGAVGAASPADMGLIGPWNAFEFGARLAFGVPLGSVAGGNGNDLSNFVSNQIVPVWLNAGVRLSSNWYVGAFVSYGIMSLASQFTKGTCDQTGIGCSANDIRLGIDAAYHVLPNGNVDPWIGVGTGFEWASVSVSGGGQTFNAGYSGWEIADLEGGVDFRLLNGALGIGPFVNVALAQYSHVSKADANGDGGSVGSSVDNQALHEWVLFGVRGIYDLKFQ